MANHSPIPFRIIWTATAATISPVILMSGPITWNLSKTFPIHNDHVISMKFRASATDIARSVLETPLADEYDIAAVIVPGPAISGAPNGTIEMSPMFALGLLS